jgi:CheY-like chemotaxis protein
MSRRHRALLVEDDAEMAEELGDLLESLGHDHLHASTQEEAELLIERGEPFCFAILDLQIPANAGSIKARVEAGLGVLELLRARFPHRNAQDEHGMQLLVMSGHAKDTPSAVNALQLGGDDFVVKPLSENKQSLPEKIRVALKRSGRESHSACAAVSRHARAKAPGQGPTAHPAAKPGFCRAVQNGVPERWIDESEYAALVADPRSFHLFLNLMTQSKERSRGGGYRDPKGNFRTVSVPTLQAIAVGEVMRSRRGLRPRDFSVESVRASKTFQEGRRKLDLRLDTGEWRSLKTLPADTQSEIRFMLNPEKGIRCLLLHDLPDPE